MWKKISQENQRSRRVTTLLSNKRIAPIPVKLLHQALAERLLDSDKRYNKTAGFPARIIAIIL